MMILQIAGMLCVLVGYTAGLAIAFTRERFFWAMVWIGIALAVFLAGFGLIIQGGQQIRL